MKKKPMPKKKLTSGDAAKIRAQADKVVSQGKGSSAGAAY